MLELFFANPNLVNKQYHRAGCICLGPPPYLCTTDPSEEAWEQSTACPACCLGKNSRQCSEESAIGSGVTPAHSSAAASCVECAQLDKEYRLAPFTPPEGASAWDEIAAECAATGRFLDRVPNDHEEFFACSLYEKLANDKMGALLEQHYRAQNPPNIDERVCDMRTAEGVSRLATTRLFDVRNLITMVRAKPGWQEFMRHPEYARYSSQWSPLAVWWGKCLAERRNVANIGPAYNGAVGAEKVTRSQTGAWLPLDRLYEEYRREAPEGPRLVPVEWQEEFRALTGCSRTEARPTQVLVAGSQNQYQTAQEICVALPCWRLLVTNFRRAVGAPNFLAYL